MGAQGSDLDDIPFSGAEIYCGTNCGSPGVIQHIASGPATSAALPKKSPEKWNIIKNRALSAHCRAKIRTGNTSGDKEVEGGGGGHTSRDITGRRTGTPRRWPGHRRDASRDTNGAMAGTPVYQAGTLAKTPPGKKGGGAGGTRHQSDASPGPRG